MTRIVTVKDLLTLIQKVTLNSFFLQLIEQLKSDYARWPEFQKSPRHAIHVPEGVIELMPIADKNYYSFKYVNGHPNNTQNDKLTVVATGQLSEVSNGYPLLFSEMTLLTAFRTAATSALASTYLARNSSKTFGIIGTGSQSEFQVLAHYFSLGITEIYYFDVDVHAMDKFAHNLKSFSLKLHRCTSGEEVVQKSDIITTATAKKGHQKIIHADWIKKGAHVNGIGGDTPGKTELDPSILKMTKIVVELTEQSLVEGEIQQAGKSVIFAELWEIVTGKKKGRTDDQEITLFDSVGFALEDYSALALVNRLCNIHNIGHELDMIPTPSDPKNLFGVVLS